MYSFRVYIAVFVSVFLGTGCIAGSQGHFPKPLGAVTDCVQLLSEAQQQTLQYVIDSFEQVTTHEIVIVIVDSITPYKHIADYAKDLGNEWGVGKKHLNTGLVIVLCRGCREVRVAAGLGIEGVLTDSMMQVVVSEHMIPEFKADRYYEGLRTALYSIMALWPESKEYLPD